MKKLLYLLTLTFFVFTSCEQDQEIIDVTTDTAIVNKKPVKIPVCHYNKGNDTYKTMYVTEKQLQKYLDNGDKRGACGYTYVPDNGFEQHLINEGYDDVLDNYVLTSNINSVEFLTIGMYISYEDEFGDWISFVVKNLVGLEDFISLKRLMIVEAYALNTPVDLSTLINLERLNIYATPIPELDLSKNINLRSLSISGGTHIKTIDLSNSPLLTTIGITDNHLLISLDLKNGSNSLITIFSSFSNPLLTCIQVDDFTVDNIGDAPYNNWNKDYWTSYSKDCGN